VSSIDKQANGDEGVTLRVYGHLFAGAQVKLSEQLDALREATATPPPEATVIDFAERRTE